MNVYLEDSGKFDLQGHSILIIDDEPINLGVMSDYLRHFSVGVLVARDGESGLERARYAQPDLILLDVLMPGIDGFETCRQLKADEITKDIPVIFMTALTDTQDKVKGFQLGAVDYITKPFQHEEVLVRVTTHLRLRELTERLEHRVRERTQELATANQQLQREITERVRAEELLRKSNQAYKALSDCNQMLVHTTEEGKLLQEVCRIIMEDCGYHLVWVGFAEQDEAKTVRPVAQSGYEEGYLDTASITWADTELGRGPTGAAIRTKKPVINQDVLTDPDFAPWRAEAVERKYASSAAFPLLTSEQEAMGALTVYASEPEAFTPEQVDLLMELTDDLTFGLVSLRVRAERERAEEAYRASVSRFTDLFNKAAIPLCFTSKHKKEETTLHLNAHFEKTFGYSHEEIPTLNEWWQLAYPDPVYRERVIDTCRVAIQRAVNTESDIEPVEYRVTCKNGDVRTMVVYGSFIGDELLLTFFDITDRERVEEALRQSERRFRALYEDNPSMYFTVDAQGTVLSVNPFGADQLGYTVEELIGQSVLDVFYPDDRGPVQQQLAACLEHPGEVAHWEFRKVRQDGSMLWVREAARAVQGSDGRPVVLVVCEDITERKQAEEEREYLLAQVQEQARRMQEIMDTVPEGVLLLDADCRVLLANPLGQRDLATLTNAQIGDTFTHLGDRSLAELLTSPPKGLWHEVATENRSFQTIARPIENGPTPEGWVLVIRDVTQQREVERRVQQQERLAAIGQLAAGIAHDFNNIMAIIVLYAQMTAQVEALPAHVQERMEIINQQARHATRLIQQILDFSRRSVLERQPLDLLPLLKEQCKLLERTLPENIEISLDYEPAEYIVNADLTRMQQVLMNLAVNARDAMSKGGKLRFTLSRELITDKIRCVTCDEIPNGEWVRLAVTDTGSGILSEVLPHIFEPFFTTKAPGQGTGLGLSQVYGIVRAHEGHIDVSTKRGKGTTFIIYLPPLLTHRPETPVLETQAVVSGRGETLLVVEDDATLRKVLAETLRSLNYRVLEAANGQEALDTLRQSVPEIALVISDLVMPGMGGRVLFHTMRQRNLTLPVIMLSGHPMEQELQSLQAEGLAGWLLKPPDIEQLSQLLAQALKEKD